MNGIGGARPVADRSFVFRPDTEDSPRKTLSPPRRRGGVSAAGAEITGSPGHSNGPQRLPDGCLGEIVQTGDGTSELRPRLIAISGCDPNPRGYRQLAIEGAMPVKMPIYRLSKIQHDTEMDLLREFARQAGEILKQNPKPDTFLGRKTREPFPDEGNRH